MVELLLAILKGLLPFLKESLLEGGTLREWVTKNRSTCVWLLFHAVMLMVVVHLASSHYKQNQRIVTLYSQNTTLSRRVTELEQTNQDLIAQYTQKKIDHQVTANELADLTEELSIHKGAAAMCGVTVRPDGTFQCPRATPTPRATARRTPPRRVEPTPPPPAVEPHKPTFGERLRSIFKPNKE